MCWFQLTLRYTSISTNARWDFLKLIGSRDLFWRGLGKPLNRATSLSHVPCLLVWVFVTIYGNIWYFYHLTSSVNLNTPIVRRSHHITSHHITSHHISIRTYGDWLILKLINWIIYSIFSLKSLLWSRGDDHTWVVTYFVEKD